MPFGKGWTSVWSSTHSDASVELSLRWKGRTRKHTHKKHQSPPCSLKYESHLWQNEIFQVFKPTINRRARTHTAEGISPRNFPSALGKLSNPLSPVLVMLHMGRRAHTQGFWKARNTQIHTSRASFYHPTLLRVSHSRAKQIEEDEKNDMLILLHALCQSKYFHKTQKKTLPVNRLRLFLYKSIELWEKREKWTSWQITYLKNMTFLV